VLERAFLPNDAHSFAKYYVGADTKQLTPFDPDATNTDLKKRGLTICNTSEPSDRSLLSQQTVGADAPLLRVAKGNYSLWASNERWQCRWGTGTNDNNPDNSGISAYAASPNTSEQLGVGDYIVRVKVCMSEPNATNNEHCKAYGSNYKPIGLLQTYGYNDAIYFGLMTGSYKKNKSGGVLRKAIGSISDEINTDGTFKKPESGKSIIGTLNLLRIYGYRFDDGTYHGKDNSDKCVWATFSFEDGSCTNWGNPQGEIYLESLRYLAGKSITTDFATDDSTRIKDLNYVSSFTDPINTSANGNYCAPINVLQFNASSTSYDSDQLGGASGITEISSYESATDTIGVKEGFVGTTENPVQVFIGENGVVNSEDTGYQLCSAKSVDAFSALKGICPESPRLEGSYKMAGLAYLARKNGIGTGRQKVKTFGVALAPALPKITVAVPNVSGKTIEIIPACRNTGMAQAGSCAIVDFKIVSNTLSNGTASGKLYVNWEDSEHGGDYDQDMWGTIDYAITSTTVTITTKVYAQSADYKMGFGYIISGTTVDGYHAHSGINGYSYTNASEVVECNSCKKDNAATTRAYTVGNTTAKTLQPPLYYAAKWGGYKADNLTADEIAASTPETYFYATDPYKLEASLKVVLDQIKATNGSAATVAANSTRLDTETLVYQATFNAEDWSGGLTALKLNANGSVGDKKWTTDQTLTRTAVRKIYTYDSATADGARSLVLLNATALPTTSALNFSNALKKSSETTYDNATLRYKWLLGSDQNEEPTGLLRKRTVLLGDIVNSDPAFAGRGSQRYDDLSATYGGPSYAAYAASKNAKDSSGQYVRKAAVFVGANDGMLHAFDADTGAELFAYIPRGVYAKLKNLSDPAYTHEYSVDGPTYAGDVYYDSNNDGVKEWRTIVTGTLGAGGRGAYALDITDALGASSGDPKVVFDISADDATLSYKNDLGFASGKAFTVPMKNGSWMVLFGNGNNSVNGYAKLIAIDIQTPSNVIVIDTGAKDGDTSNNGLNGLALLPDGNGIISMAYSGDVIGNMWKFDLSNSNTNQWKLGFNSGKPLVKVIDSAGNPQPIFASPTLGYNDLRKDSNGVSAVMVYFGTGKYYDTTDNSSTGIQSIYAIMDLGGANDYLSLSAANRTTLLQQKTITAQSTSSRTVSPDATASDGTKAVNWNSKYGWFLDLKYGSEAGGERVLSKPLLLFDRLILPTFKPSSNQCDYGGSGWLMELTAVGDKFIGQTVLDTAHANHSIDGVILGDLLPIITGEKIAILGSGMKKATDGSGTVTTLNTYSANTPGGVRGRMSWRQIK
jgi:type IV pilus assembly protein PilY1